MPIIRRCITLLILLAFLCLTQLYAGGVQEEDTLEQAQTLIVEGKYDKAILLLTKIINRNDKEKPQAEALLSKIRTINVDSGLAQARAYINDKKYDLALELLGQIIRKNDERLDDAEALVEQIRLIRGNYNDLFQELYTTIKAEPENNEKILALIEKMKELDKYPNAKAQEQLEKARLTAKLQVDRNLRNKILAQARLEIARNEYATAVQTYRSGFNLQRPEFEGGVQKAEFKTSVFKIVTAVDGSSQLSKSEEDAFRAWLNTYLPLIPDATPTKIQQSLDQLVPIYDALLARRTALAEFGKSIDLARVTAEKDYPQYIYNEYIRFIQEFINGPPAQKGKEGILSALDAQKTWAQNSWLNPLDQKIRTMNADLLAFLNQDQIIEAQQLRTQLAQYYELGINAVNIAAQSYRITAPGGQIYAGFPANLAEQKARYELQKIAYASLNEYLTNWQARPVAPSDEANFSANLQVYSRALSLLDRGDTTLLQWKSQSAIHRSALGSTSTVASELDSLLESWRTRLSEDILSVNITLLVRMADIQHASADQIYQSANTILNIVNELIEGKSVSVTDIEKRNPTEALSRIVQQEPLLLKAVEALDSSIKRHADVPISLKTNLQVQGIDQRAKDLLAKIKALQGLSITWRRTAELRIQEAKEFQRQAEAALLVTDAAIKARNVKLAETRLDEVTKAYTNSLERQDNSALRESSEVVIKNYKEKIRQLVVELALAQIEVLIKKSVDSLDREDYEKALDLVIEAKREYANVLPENNMKPELVALEQRIRNYSTLSQERYLNEADPAYNTIVNYQNLARLDIEQARNLNGAAKIDSLNRAKQSINNVLSIKPNNLDARLLVLVVDQVLDPADFIRKAELRLNDTISRKGTTDLNTYLTELQALAEFIPRNARLIQEIKLVRIQLGLIESDVTIENRNRAKTLFEKARQNANSNNRDILIAALKDVEESLALNPNNSDARILADRLRIKTGTPPTKTLSLQDEALLRKAIRLNNEGNFLDAITIVNALWANQANRSFVPLIDLRAILEQQRTQ